MVVGSFALRELELSAFLLLYDLDLDPMTFIRNRSVYPMEI